MEKHRSLIWSAFPVVYGAAFLLTLFKAVVAFWTAELPLNFHNAFPLDSDRVYARWSLNIFSAAVGVFMVVLYIRLEIFEHEPEPELPRLKEKSVGWRVVEYFMRVCIVAIITWKIVQWNDYSTLLRFYMVLTIAFAFWILVLRSAALSLALPQKMSYFLMPIFCILVNCFGSASALFSMSALIFVAALTALSAVTEIVDLFGRVRSLISSVS